jgi:hypothetical protein
MGNDPNARWGVLWLWENKINQVLENFGEVFDKLICIRRLGDSYTGYFTLKDAHCTFCQVNIHFVKGHPRIKRLFFWSIAKDLYLIRGLNTSDLIYDKKDEFIALAEEYLLNASDEWDD